MKKLNELTIENAVKGLKDKEFTSVELVTACLDQIEKYNEALNAYLTVIPKEELLSKASEADKKIKESGAEAFIKQPLLGIPYACKDNLNTKGVLTTASSKILDNYIPPYESTVTQRLKDAGAIMLGKTNLDAFAHGSSTETSDFGPTKNPWDVDRIPGGSSGGSAAAVAAHMCIFAIGSETAGSIRGPASWTGITGFKPTYGRVSRYGAIAMASSTDSPGPMTKTVYDAALVLEVIAGKDDFDATSSPVEVDKYTDSLRSGIDGIRIGVPKSYFDIEMDEDYKSLIMNSIEKFKELGAEIIEMDLLDPKYSIAVYTILQRSEVSSNLARFSGVRYGHTRDHFGHEAKKRMMLGAYALSAGYYDAFYAKAQRARTKIVEDFNKAYESVDLIIGPTLPVVALKIGESEANPLFGEYIDMLQEPSSIAGLTAISLPCGLSQNLPVGVQLIGPQFSESLVFKVASAYQQATDFHMQFPDLTNIADSLGASSSKEDK